VESNDRELKDRFIVYVRHGISVDLAARLLKVRPYTIYSWLRKDGGLLHEYKKASAACILDVLDKLVLVEEN